MVDGGIGITAAVGVGSKFMERSKFTARHNDIYDREVDKSIRYGVRFDNIPKEDVDQFEFHQYNILRDHALQNLREYRNAQEEYKQLEWYKQPIQKFRSRSKVRKAKRRVLSASTQEGWHIDELETYSRSLSGSRCSSMISFNKPRSEAHLDLERDRLYRSDTFSLRATGGSPPFLSLEDLSRDENRDMRSDRIWAWLSGIPQRDFSPPDHRDSDPMAEEVPTQAPASPYLGGWDYTAPIKDYTPVSQSQNPYSNCRSSPTDFLSSYGSSRSPSPLIAKTSYTSCPSNSAYRPPSPPMLAPLPLKPWQYPAYADAYPSTSYSLSNNLHAESQGIYPHSLYHPMWQSYGSQNPHIPGETYCYGQPFPLHDCYYPFQHTANRPLYQRSSTSLMHQHGSYSFPISYFRN